MSLQEYTVNRDKFKADDGGGEIFGFPCCCCEYKNQPSDAEPCRTCDHNVNSVPDKSDYQRPDSEGAL